MAKHPDAPAWREAMERETRDQKRKDVRNARARTKNKAAKPAREAAKAARKAAFEAQIMGLYEQAAYDEQLERDREAIRGMIAAYGASL